MRETVFKRGIGDPLSNTCTNQKAVSNLDQLDLWPIRFRILEIK